MSFSDMKNTIYGSVPLNWELTKISEYTNLVTDYVANGSFASLKKNVQYKKEEDYAVMIRLADYNSGYKSDFVFIGEDSYHFLKKSKLFGNEIIISNVGANVGTVFKCPKLNYKMSLAPNSIMIKTKGVDDFFFYWFKSKYGQFAIKSIVSGSAQPKFNKTDFRNLKIPVPPLEEQKAIAATLSCLDDKIELNNRMNQTLEEMAQAIFKSWFVDFEPFQDGEFVDSELGRIPKGWRVGSLGEIIALLDSKRIPLSKRVREKMHKKYPYYGATCMMDYVEDYLFDGIYVLLGEDGSVADENGYPILQYVWGQFWVNNHAHILKARLGFSEESLYIFLKNTNVQSIVTGAVQLKINQKNLKTLKIIIPEEIIIKEYNEVIAPLFGKIRKNEDEKKFLTETRNTLLPKLMSGEVRVPVPEVK